MVPGVNAVGTLVTRRVRWVRECRKGWMGEEWERKATRSCSWVREWRGSGAVWRAERRVCSWVVWEVEEVKARVLYSSQVLRRTGVC